MQRVRLLALGVVGALSLGACASAAVTLTIDDTRLEPLEASAQIDTSTPVTVILLSLHHAGPANVSDSGITYAFRVELSASPQTGATLDVDGTAMLDIAPDGTNTRVFTAGPNDDERVIGLYATALCFCGGVRHAEQTVSGHIDVVDASASGLSLEVDLVVDGVIPGPSVHQRLHLQGHFDVPPPT